MEDKNYTPETAHTSNISIKIRQFMSRYMYGLIVAIIVWVALILVPMFNTDGMVGLRIPEDKLARIAYFTIRGIVAVLVFMIFVLFDMQGKNNVLDDPRYLEAYNMLNNIEDKEYVPVSPAKYKAKTYGFKAVTLSVTTCVTACIMMEMVLSYNWILLASYALSIIFACINGLIQMKKAEIYWTEEYFKYAIYVVKHDKDNFSLEDRNDSQENHVDAVEPLSRRKINDSIQ